MIEHYMYALGHLDELDPWGSNAYKRDVASGFAEYMRLLICYGRPIDESWREYARSLQALAARQGEVDASNIARKDVSNQEDS